MSYKLIAFDMDGTLLNSQKQISADSIAAINRATAAGKIVCLSTGRGLAELKIYLDQLQSLQYFISYSGAAIWDNRTKRNIVLHPFPRHDVLKMFALGKQYDVMPHILSEQSLTQNDQTHNLVHYHMGIYQDLYDKITTNVPDLQQYYLDHPDLPVLKFNMYFAHATDRDKARSQIDKMPVTTIYAEQTSLECSPKNITKGSALKELCSLLDIPLAETIAVGDSNNDLEILQTAGLAVVMGNGNDDAKAVADVIVRDNDHGGCVQAIEEYLLK